MSNKDLGKGAVYLYIETMATMFSGYIIWLMLTKITTTEVIGTSSAVLSMSGIFTTVVILGVPNGVQRFLAKSFADQRMEDVKIFIVTSLLLVSVAVLVCTIGMFLSSEWITKTFRIDASLIIISIIFVATSAVATLLRSMVIATLKTKILPIVSIASTIVKLVGTISLIYFDMRALGVTIGFTLYPLVSSIILAISIFLMIGKESIKSKMYKREVSLRSACEVILTASMASWVPGLIATVGTQLGLIIVLGWHGAGQAGVYAICFSIVTGLSSGISVLSSIAFPALSAMIDGRKRFAWRIMKMSLTISLPFSSSLVFYSAQVMSMFGPDYIEGSSILGILLLSMLPTSVAGTINTLAYSYGNYKQVLAIGLASTIPRILFYFILVPIYGGVGAALSYSAGSIVVFIISLIIAKKIGMKLFWKDLTFLFIIPIGISFMLSQIGVNYIVGIIVTIFLSYVLFLKMLILDRTDVQDVLGILPTSVSTPTIGIITKIGRKLNRSF